MVKGKDKTDIKMPQKVTHKKAVPVKVDEIKMGENIVVEQEKQENFIRAVGRRKSAVARVRLYQNGSGKIEINGKDYKNYFPYFELYQKVVAPLKAVGKRNDFDFRIKVVGGGQLGQAEACLLGVARCLIKFNSDYKKTLRPAGFVTRDPRVKERKKFGLKKARRAPQWQKR